MSRLRPLSSALLSFGLLVSGQSALPLPVAAATPEPGAGQTPSPAPPAAAARPQNWGSCDQFLTDTSDVPTAQCTTVSVPVDYANPGGAQAKLAVIRVPATGRRIGVAVDQPGRPGRVGGRHGRRHGIGPGKQRHHPRFRPGRVRPARGGPLDPAGAVPQRRRIRRVAARTDGRLQPGRRGAHRAAQPAVGPAMRTPDGQRVLGQRRHRVRRARHGHGSPGAG